MRQGGGNEDARRINRLALKLLALLLLSGGGLAFVLAILISRLPSGLVNGRLAYAVPGGGGRTWIDTHVVIAMAWAGAVLAATGTIGFLLAGAVRFDDVQAGQVSGSPASPHRRHRSRLMLLAGIIALLAALAKRWFS